MTDDQFPTTWRGRLIEVSKLVGAVATIVATGWAAWSITYGPVRGFFDDLYAFQEDIRTRQDRLRDDLARLREDVRELRGENRVIRETPGLTYVAEPVRVGDRVRFHFQAERTSLGEPCVLQRSIPIYTDERNIPTPGPERLAARQIGSSLTPLAPTYEMPADIRPGRVVMHLNLEYICNGQPVRDRTTSAAFTLLPAE
jgi:hypothetical protein